MAYQRPLLRDLIGQTQADIIAAAGNLLPIDILMLLATDQAGLANLHHGHIDRVSIECTPWSAVDMLESWAALRGVLAVPAAFSTGTAIFTGANGVLISAGLTATRQDGAAFTISVGATVASGAATVTLIANLAGAAGNCPAGTPFTLSAAPAGVNAAGVAGSAFTGGANVEGAGSLRTRMLAVYAAPPQGGALSDYVQWARAVPGVTRAWAASRAMGSGTVTIYTMFDITEAAYAGFPQGTTGGATSETRISAATGDQLAVANAIYPLRPVTALVYSVAPVAYPVNFRIIDFLPATAAIQTAITAALAAAFARSAAPGGTDWPVTTAGTANGYVYMSVFAAALDVVPGLLRYTMVTPNSAVVAPAGNIPTLGTITWV